MEIKDLILQGKNLADISEKEKLQRRYDLWCSRVRISMEKAGFVNRVQEEIKVKMHYMENEYSDMDTLNSLKKSLNSVIQTLEEKTVLLEKSTDGQVELKLIEKMLSNFYMYYRAMYKEAIHKRGTLKAEHLNAICIGNEYDLQRMLYSILLPIFPTLRQEVYSDNGYGGMRADMYLDIYNLVIETKCTRKSMSEKQLLEELGADAFHYNAEIIYFFVCDKIGIIKNPEALRHAFAREQKKDGKTVKMFILQATEL